MNGIDNIAGYTLTVGTADFVISDSIAQYDPIVDNLADGDERNYKAQFIDPSFGDDYETGRGTWNAGAGTISRTTIKTSSNNGSIVNFGAGPKVVFIVSDYESLTDMNNMVDSAEGAGSLKMTTAERTNIAANVALLATRGEAFTADYGTTAGTIAEGDDARFGSVDIGDLTPAASIDGTELVPADQGGDGVSITTQQIAGNPVTDVRTFAMDRVQGYTNFNGLQYVYTNAVDGTVAQLEKFLVNRGGAGSQVYNGSFLLGSTCLSMTTGTDTTGYCCVTHFEYPIRFDPTKEYDQTWSAFHSALPTVGEASTTQIGFLVGAPALAAQGMYFYLDELSNNWYYAVKNAGGTTSATTTIAGSIDNASPQALRVHYDPVAASTKFYIDGTLRGTVTNATRVVGTTQALAMGMSIRKSAGIAGNIFVAYHHSFNIQRSVLANF